MAKKIKKIDMLIAESLKVVMKYKITFTLRQIFYRLFATGIIKNNTSEYKYLSKALVKGRKNGSFPYDKMEDRTRKVINHAHQWYQTPQEAFEELLKKISDEVFVLPINLYQPKIVVVALEKEALSSIFENIVKKWSNTFLIVCRGFNSLSQLHELAEKLLDISKEVHCVFFSDFDPSGIYIQSNFEKQMLDLGIEFETYQRIALTQEQIDFYKLPSVPAKKSDSRAKDWIGGVVELDALDPPILEKLIEESIKPFWDYNISNEVKRLRTVLERKYQRMIEPIKETLRNEGYDI